MTGMPCDMHKLSECYPTTACSRAKQKLLTTTVASAAVPSAIVASLQSISTEMWTCPRCEAFLKSTLDSA